MQLHFKGTLLASYEFAFANVGKQGNALASLLPPPQTEIDVISLPVVPKEMFCSISSPFRLSPIYVRSWGPATKNHCRYHQGLRLAKFSSCGFMPTLTKVYFLDNMFLFGPTFLVFLSLLFFFLLLCKTSLTVLWGLKLEKKKHVYVCLCVCICA